MSVRGRATVALVAAGVLGALLLAARVLTTAPRLPAAGAVVMIREGDGVGEIARRLATAGIVRSALLFRVWARWSGRDRALRPGTYRFAAPTEIPEVLTRLAAGVEPIEITVPEGLTVREVTALVAARGLASRADVGCLAADPEFLLAAGVPGPQLEGYLFPDTYRFAPTAAPGEILETMVRRFHERFDADRHRRAAELGWTVNQVITLASIVEKETGKPDERPLVAAVLANRLRLGMPLQSDPTVIYGLPDFGGDLTRADLARATPYNTYVVRGLPPGPIANPGVAAIDAVLAPARSDALYFVSRNDGSHEFSETLPKHNRAVDRYQRRSR
ncbi:MAG: endolytic transglycosylase MltG [Deltaproteobacteria bacterium]|nr:endolytic transglycosylase MltG [Deltaproteobacteria bacterium]